MFEKGAAAWNSRFRKSRTIKKRQKKMKSQLSPIRVFVHESQHDPWLQRRTRLANCAAPKEVLNALTPRMENDDSFLCAAFFDQSKLKYMQVLKFLLPKASSFPCVLWLGDAPSYAKGIANAVSLRMQCLNRPSSRLWYK